ncbi:hypothetical protein GCM10027285_19130 [Oleiagrimonas citrea]
MLYAGYICQGFGSMIHSITSCQERRTREVQPTVPVAVSYRHDGSCARARGFTLVELMITVAVAAVLVAIAIPSFKSITLSNRMTTVANDMVDAINTAKLEAVKRNNFAQFCSNVAANNGSDTLGSACGTMTGAAVLLQDPNASSASDKTFLAHAENTQISGPLKLNGDIKAVRFDGQGIGHAIGSTAPMNDTLVDICTDQLSSNNHRVIQIVTGSIITTTTTTGTCP